MWKNKIYVCLIALLLVISASCGSVDQNTVVTNEPPSASWDEDFDGVSLTNEEGLLMATHIMEAVYVMNSEDGDCLFAPSLLIKGKTENDWEEISDTENDLIKVYAASLPKTELKENETYFLILKKIVSVYEPKGIFYIYVGDRVITKDDESWESLHELAHEIVKEGKGEQQPFIGTRFTKGTPEKIIHFASYIFRVKVLDPVYTDASDSSQRTAYNLKVLGLIKGNPDHQKDIIVSFPGHVVEEGEEYIILTESAGGDDSVVFALSSLEGSVYTTDQAEENQTLKALMLQEKTYAYEDDEPGPPDVIGDLKKEWEYSKDMKPECWYKSEDGCRLFFDNIVYAVEGEGEAYQKLLEKAGDFGRVIMADFKYFLDNKGYQEGDESPYYGTGIKAELVDDKIRLSCDDFAIEFTREK